MKSEQLARSMNWKRVAPFIAIFLLVLLLKPLSQWISPVPPQLVFDPYLTEERLDVLFNGTNLVVRGRGGGESSVFCF